MPLHACKAPHSFMRQPAKVSSGVNGTTALSFSQLYLFMPGFGLPLPFKDSTCENDIKTSTYRESHSKRDSVSAGWPSALPQRCSANTSPAVIHCPRDTRPTANQRHPSCGTRSRAGPRQGSGSRNPRARPLPDPFPPPASPRPAPGSRPRPPR